MSSKLSIISRNIDTLIYMYTNGNKCYTTVLRELIDLTQDMKWCFDNGNVDYGYWCDWNLINS
jgi:hypothetical protein